ncbi:type II toxin-antitoxin system prevent-host-death family antitoxin [Streptomyces sp. KL116D]|uniref:type II toxin-antitoxin system prevent-host-death family antitoxin n=1 Tax=Streptomyces sp. KL116D TaxID=3045152 RepID=UPI00355866AB
MTYTLAMAAEQGIRIAEDGVAEVSMTGARANLTQLLREVRYGKRTAAFTERGARSAYVVPPEDYAEIAVMRELRERLARLEAKEGAPATTDARVIREALEGAERRTSDT